MNMFSPNQQSETGGYMNIPQLDMSNFSQGIDFDSPDLQMGLPPIRTMNELYHPQMGAQQKFSQFINEFPERQEPSKWRKLGAVLYGMGQKNPVEASRDFTNYHYDNAVNDWKLRAPFIQQDADNERQANVNERQLAYNQIQNDVANRRVADSEQKTNNAEKRTKIYQQRTDIADAVSRGVQTVVFDEKTGLANLIMKDGTTRVLDVSHVTPKEKAQIQKEIDAARIGAQGTQSRLNIGAQGEQTRENIKATGDQTRQNIDARASGAGLKESDKVIRAKRLAGIGISEHPEWAPYMEFDSMNNQFLNTKLPPGGDRATLNRINDWIYEGQMPGQQSAPVTRPQGNVPRVGDRVGDADNPGQTPQQKLAEERMRSEAIQILKSKGYDTSEESIKKIVAQMKARRGGQ